MSDKRPKCKLCGAQHQLGEPHSYTRDITTPPQRDIAAPVSALRDIACPSCAGLRSELAAVQAELTALRESRAKAQRAYRERKR